MQSFTRTNIDEVGKDIKSVLEVAAESLGINLSLGTITYLDDSFTVTLKGIAEDADGNAMNPHELAYTKAKTDDMLNLGDTFESRGIKYKICGWKPRASKYPLLAKREDGKKYKFNKKFAYKSGKAPKDFRFF